MSGISKVIAAATGNRIIIRQSEAETKRGVFEVPDTQLVKPVRGEVVAVSESWTAPNGTVVLPTVKIGNTVLYDPYSGTPIEKNGEELLVMEEHKAFAII